MSVLKGEGKVPILYGTYSTSVGTVNPSFYVARPDLTGAFPTVVISPPAWGLTPSVKHVCRTLARWGLSAVATDPYNRKPPDRDLPHDDAAARHAEAHLAAVAALRHAAGFVSNPSVFWSNAEHGFGVLGMGTGGDAAVETAARLPGVEALALTYTPLRTPGSDEDTEPPGLIDAIAGLPLPLLGLYGKDDDRVPVADVMALRDASPHAELVLYPQIGHDFLDDYRDGFDFGTMRDAVDRLVAFFIKQLPEGDRIE